MLKENQDKTQNEEVLVKTGNYTNNSIFLNKGVLNCKSGGAYTPHDVVKILLRERALKQVDLADQIGLSRQALNNYISGRFATPTEIKLKIAQALNVDSAVIWDLRK